MEFSNKHAIITGGANGIGRCIAEAFLREGAAVTIIDIDKHAGEALDKTHDKLRFFCGDIAEKETLERYVTFLNQPPVHSADTPCGAAGLFPLHVDCLINNACIGRGGLLSGCSYDDFEYVQRVGVTAPYYLTSLLLKGNLLAPRASIVNISSTRANQSQPDTEAYSAAKGGIASLTHAMAISLAGKARVNAINPGWIETANYHGEVNPAERSRREHPAGSPVNSYNPGWSGASAPTHLWHPGNLTASVLTHPWHPGSSAVPSPARLLDPDNRQHPAGRIGTPEDIAEMVLFLCSTKAEFITGESINIDGGMSRLMVYHNDNGWKLE